jgi:hypothetical protein
MTLLLVMFPGLDGRDSATAGGLSRGIGSPSPQQGLRYIRALVSSSVNWINNDAVTSSYHQEAPR